MKTIAIYTGAYLWAGLVVWLFMTGQMWAAAIVFGAPALWNFLRT